MVLIVILIPIIFMVGVCLLPIVDILTFPVKMM